MRREGVRRLAGKGVEGGVEGGGWKECGSRLFALLSVMMLFLEGDTL